MSPSVAKDVDELVGRLVRPGDHVHLAATPSRPNALTYALCRVFGDRGHLTVSTTAVHSSAHALALSGVADKVIAGFAGDTYPSPRPNPLYADLEQGRPFTFEAWSLLSYVQRLIAGAQGAPYAVTASLSGTDLAEGKPDSLHLVADPARPGEQVTLLTPLLPDVALVHGVAADEDGNIALAAPLGEGAWSAYAARRGVVASVEKIISREEMRRLADRVVIPGQRVLGICEAPLGAHPQSLRTGGIAGVEGYLDDYAFLEEIVASCHGPQRGQDWYRQWVTGPGSHDGYLRRLGRGRRFSLTDPSTPAGSGFQDDPDLWQEITPPRDTSRPGVPDGPVGGAPGSGRRAGAKLLDSPLRSRVDGTDDDYRADTELWQEINRIEQASRDRAAARALTAAPLVVPAPGPQAPATRQERLIVLGARAVAALVREHGYDTLLAGIGTSHMAAWLAAEQLNGGGHDVKIVAELGMYGFTPEHGDVYLFSLRHAARSEMLAGIPEILGGLVAANPRALGVLAAAEIDPSGAINTSRGADGRWLTGSGGANDIASSSDCVVVAPSSRRRYVPQVGYRTSPGHRVRAVVSDFGRFDRIAPEGGFRLATWLGSDSPTGPADTAGMEEQAAEAVAERTSWTPQVAGVTAEKPVTEEELLLLRSLDPAGRYR